VEDDAVSSEDDDEADSDDDPDDDVTQSGDESGEEGAPLAKKGPPLAKKGGAPLAKKGAPLAKKGGAPPAQKRSSFFLGGEESAGEESSGHEDELLEAADNRTSRKANINVFKIFHCYLQCSGCVSLWFFRIRMLPSASKKIKKHLDFYSFFTL
jgi:hypothetical protein